MATTITAPTKPTVGGSDGTWGTTLNTALDTLKTNDDNLKTTADAALPASGGTMTGALNAKTTTIAGSELASVSGAVTLDLSVAQYFSMTLTGDTTFTTTNVPASGLRTGLILDITNGGAHTITWFGTILWASGVVPTLTASGRDVLAFLTGNGGGGWLGWVIGKDFR